MSTNPRPRAGDYNPAASSGRPFTAYDPEPRRDLVRCTVALSVLLSLLVIVSYCLYAAGGDYTKSKEILDELMPAFTGFIDSAIGFYFGTRAEENR